MNIALQCLFLLLIAVAGGCLPLLVRWTDRTLHLALALSTGVFLGAVFLHLLPELSVAAPTELVTGPAETGPAETGAAEHDHAPRIIWTFVLVGVLAVYLVETLLFRSHDHDDLLQHRAVGYATLVGLSIHALTAGVGLSAMADQESLETPVFLALLCHKAFEAFSLSSVFQLADFSRGRIVGLTLAFSVVTPAGVLLGSVALAGLSPLGVAIFTALAAGTFLFVCLCELLPEVFHHREDGGRKISLMIAGIAVMALLHGAGL